MASRMITCLPSRVWAVGVFAGLRDAVVMIPSYHMAGAGDIESGTTQMWASITRPIECMRDTLG